MTFEYKTVTLPFNVFGRAKALSALLTSAFELQGHNQQHGRDPRTCTELNHG